MSPTPDGGLDKEALFQLDGPEGPLYQDRTMPIAVVGIGFRGPGDAINEHRLFDMISQSREAWSPIPEEKFNLGAFYHPDSNRNGTINVTGGHYFKADLAQFDAPFFNMTRGEAVALDPQQRLLLECCYEAFENAGTPLERIVGSTTAVFIGTFFQDYTDLLLRDPETLPLYQSTSSGQSRAMISNRLSYFYDLKGPSVTIDSACSSSLVALHLACQSLRCGESKQALVGGANVILTHETMISMSAMRFLSPDGRCYTFDSRANGYSRGEGAGCLFLKPLAAALEDGDTIRGIIRNTGVNQDGKTAGITLPSREAQEQLIKSVYDEADLDPLETTYVEAHGTGTPAGDPIEAAAISARFCADRAQNKPLTIGSVKTNVGHLEGASGVTGVIKAILMLENRLILPNRNFEKVNPRIPLEQWKLRVPTSVEPWTSDGPLRASINSFGYGGTNAHAIIDGAADYLFSHNLRASVRRVASSSAELHNLVGVNHNPINSRYELRNGNTLKLNSDDNEISRRLFLLSANDETAEEQQRITLVRYLQNHIDEKSAVWWDDFAYTINERRSRLAWNTVFSASSVREAISALQKKDLRPSKTPKSPVLAFVFTGQGAQWHAMGRELLTAYPIFRNTIHKAGEYLSAIGAPWCLMDELLCDAKTSRVNKSSFSQPLCTAVQLGIVKLLRSFGVKPASVTGHSSGEIAAAYAMGVITLEDAMMISYFRGVAATNLKSKLVTEGAMLAVGASKSEVLPFMSSLKKGRTTIACENSPKSVTISGDKSAVLELEKILQEKKIFARELLVEVAYHSRHMESVSEEYLAALEGLKLQHPSSDVEFYSSVTGKRVACSSLGAGYWVANMLSEVKFSDSFRSLCHETRILKKGRNRNGPTAIDLVVEIGPHSALAGPIKQIIHADTKLRSGSIIYTSALTRNSDAVMTIIELAGTLAKNGVPLDFSAINRPLGTESTRILVDLPPYSWNRSTSYWAESRISKSFRTNNAPRSDLLGVPVRNTNPLEPSWRHIIRPAEKPWVRDHKVQSNVVYPAAGYVVMAIEAALQRATSRSIDVSGYNLREVVIGQALVIPEADGEIETFISLRPYCESLRQRSDIWDEFCVFSTTNDDRWTEHCRGLISVQKQSIISSEVGGDRQIRDGQSSTNTSVTVAKENCQMAFDTEQLYAKLTDLGIEYGPTFMNMTKLYAGPGQSIGTISIPNTASVMPLEFEYPFILHPATLDSCFHPLFAAIVADPNSLKHPVVPTFIEELFISHHISNTPSDELLVYADSKQKDSRNFRTDMTTFAAASNQESPVMAVRGLICTALEKDIVGDSDADTSRIAYRAEWRPDADYVTRESFNKICSHISPMQGEHARSQLLEQAAFYLMERALKITSRLGPSNYLPQHQNLHSCMERYCKSVRDGTIGYQTSSWLILSELEKREIILKASKLGGEGDLVCWIGENLPGILRQELEPLPLMLENDRLSRYYTDNKGFERNYDQAAAYIRLLTFKNPKIRILEIGAGTGGATQAILDSIGLNDNGVPNFGCYDFTDISTGFFDSAKARLATFGNFVTFKKLDIESDPLKQGFEPGVYDLVIAANVLHATLNMKDTLTRVRQLMKPGGKLVLVELTRERMATSLIFGTLPGWWIAGRPNGPCLTESEWSQVLSITGFSGLKAAVQDSPVDSDHRGSMMVAEAAATEHPKLHSVLIITSPTTISTEIEDLQRCLTAISVDCEVEDLADAKPDGKLCIVLSGTGPSVLYNPAVDEFDAVKRVLLKSYGVLWVIRGGLRNSLDPSVNLITGLTRTVRSERADSTIVVLDLDPDDMADKHSGSQFVADVLQKNFDLVRVNNEPLDVEYIERDGVLMIQRVMQDDELNNFVASTKNPSVLDVQQLIQEGRNLTLEIGSPGLLDTLHFVNDDRLSGTLPDNSVQIEVKASGINFRDVMMAMGQIEVEPLGGECSGIITAVGSSVKGWRRGDRVVTYKIGCFSNSIRQEARAVQSIPDDMPYEVAASLPVVYTTAYHSVFNVARVVKGETVLIHAASGGLGQAMIMLCQMLGAEVFATVGTRQKKEFLVATFNIPEDHIFSSRDGNFSKGVMRKTENKGIDVIMNSVAGDALRLTWNCIAPFGRFVELGKRDLMINTRLEMQQFKRNVTFSVVDLVGLIRERPSISAKVFHDVMDLIRSGSVKPPGPIKVFGFSDIETALRMMQTGAHMGKLVAVPDTHETVKVLRDQNVLLFRRDVSYLLVGGLGGLGRATATWMVQNGARNLIFTSRSGLVKQSAKDVVGLLKSQGCKVAVYECDISSGAELDRTLELARKDMPPIRGVIQGAMVLRDAHFENLSLDNYQVTIKPKVHGTWNLHKKLPNDLDFFIMLSSLSGVIGNTSQAAYAAASTFMDSFAEYRNNQGLPAVTIDLGVVSDVGYVAEDDGLRKAIEKQGLESLTSEEVMSLLRSAISTPFRKGTAGQIIVGLGTWNSEISHAAFSEPVFSQFRHASTKSENTSGHKLNSVGKIRDNLRMAKTLQEATNIVSGAITEKMSSLLVIPPEDMVETKSMPEYGMDSLVAVEMRNWLFREMDSVVPILEILANVTPSQMARKIAMRSKLVNAEVLQEVAAKITDV